MASTRDVVLLTGATGFVGRHVLRCLLEAGRTVRVTVRTGRATAPAMAHRHVQVVATTDLFAASAASLAEILTDVDTIVHAAWYAEPGDYLNSGRNWDCLTGTIRLAQAAAEAGVRRIVGIGSCFEYDSSRGHLGVDTPLQPRTLYAAAKAATFCTLNAMMPVVGIEFVWCRLFYLYGEGEDPRRLVPYLRRQLAAGQVAELTRGTQIRDYLDVREAAELLVAVAFGSRIGPANICSGVPITVRQLAEKVADEYGRRDLLRFGVRPDNAFDPPCILGVRGQET